MKRPCFMFAYLRTSKLLETLLSFVWELCIRICLVSLDPFFLGIFCLRTLQLRLGTLFSGTLLKMLSVKALHVRTFTFGKKMVLPNVV